MNIRLLVVAALCLSVVGCKCGPSTGTNVPDYVANPVALNFEACPTKDETGKDAKGVFPDEKKVIITNQSKGTGGLKPYVLVRSNLEALVSRALFYDLVAAGTVEDGCFGVWSSGKFYPMQRAAEIGAAS